MQPPRASADLGAGGGGGWPPTVQAPGQDPTAFRALWLHLGRFPPLRRAWAPGQEVGNRGAQVGVLPRVAPPASWRTEGGSQARGPPNPERSLRDGVQLRERSPARPAGRDGSTRGLALRRPTAAGQGRRMRRTKPGAEGVTCGGRQGAGRAAIAPACVYSARSPWSACLAPCSLPLPPAECAWFPLQPRLGPAPSDYLSNE